MASFWTNKGLARLLSGDLDLDADTIKVLLVNSTGATAASKDDNFVSQVTANEISTTNYARQTLASKTVTEDDTNDRGVFDAADTNFTNVGTGGGPTAAGAWIYEEITNDASSPLLIFVDHADTQLVGNTFRIQWHADGISYLQSA